MKIAIYGAGALGGYFGARLQQAGHEVAYIARGAHLAAMQSSGLSIKSVLGDVTLEVNATDDPASIGPVDFVFFLTKLQDTQAAAATLDPLLGLETAVVTFQNGIDGASIIAEELRDHGDTNRVFAGASYISAEILSPGVVKHHSAFARLVYGESDGSMSSRINSLHEVLLSGGIESEPVDNIEARLWQKFVFLSALSGVSTLTRLSVGEVLADPETRQLYIAALSESAAVGKQVCQNLDNDIANSQLIFSESLPFQMRASMLDDLERGKPLELLHLSGAIVRLGKTHGVKTPVHQMMVQALHSYVGGKSEMS